MLKQTPDENKAYVSFNGTKIELDVTDIQIQYETETFGYGASSLAHASVEVNGRLNLMTKFEGEWKMDRCSEGSYEPIVNKLANLKLDENKKLLKKHGIVNADGTLTQRGESVFLYVLFSDEANVEKVVNVLKELDADEKARKDEK